MTVRLSIVYFNNHSCFLRNVQKGTHHEMIGELFMISQTRAFVSGEDIYTLNSIPRYL